MIIMLGLIIQIEEVGREENEQKGTEGKGKGTEGNRREEKKKKKKKDL